MGFKLIFALAGYVMVAVFCLTDIGSDGSRLRDLKSMPPGVKECIQGYKDCYKKCYKNCKIDEKFGWNANFGWECDPDALSLPERDQCLDLCSDKHEECMRKLGNYSGKLNKSLSS